MAIQLSIPTIALRFETAKAENQISKLRDSLEAIEKKSTIQADVSIIGHEKLGAVSEAVEKASVSMGTLDKVSRTIAPIVDLITQNNLDKLIAADAKLTNMQNTLTGINSMVVTVNDSLAKMNQNLANIAKTWHEAMEPVLQAQIIAGLTRTVGKMDTAGMSVKELQDTVVTMSEKLLEFKTQLDKISTSGLVGEGTIARQALSRLSAQLKKLMKGFGGLDKELKRKETDMQKFSKSVLGTVKRIGSFIFRTSEVTWGLMDLSAQLTLTRNSTDEYIKIWAEANAMMSSAVVATGASFDALSNLFRQLLLVHDVTKDFSGAVKAAGADLKEFGLLVGALRIEPVIVSQLITIAKMTGIGAREMVKHVQSLSGAIRDMAAGLLMFQDVAKILIEMPVLAADMAVAFDREFVLKLSNNVAAIAKAFVKHLGMSSAQATTAAMNVAKTFAVMSGDIRKFMGGLTDALSDDTMLMLETLMSVGVGGPRAIQMLADTSGQYFGELLEHFATALQESKRFPALFLRRMAIATKLFGTEVATALATNRDFLKTIRQMHEAESKYIDTSMQLRTMYLNLLPVILEIVKGIKNLFFEFLAGMGIVGGTGEGIENLRKGIETLVERLSPLMRSLGRVFNLMIRIAEVILLPLKPLLSLISRVLEFTDTIEKSGGAVGSAVMKMVDLFVILGGVVSTVFYGKIMKAIILTGKDMLIKFSRSLGLLVKTSKEAGEAAGKQLTLSFFDKIKAFGWGKLGRFFGKIGVRLGVAALAGLSVALEKRSTAGKVVSLGFQALGITLGAIIGSAVPGLGTTAGMIIGDIAGTLIGEYVADKLEPVEPVKPTPAEPTEPTTPPEESIIGDRSTSMILEQQEQIISELRGIRSSVNTLAKVDRVNVNISQRGNLNEIVNIGVEREMLRAVV